MGVLLLPLVHKAISNTEKRTHYEEFLQFQPFEAIWIEFLILLFIKLSDNVITYKNEKRKEYYHQKFRIQLFLEKFQELYLAEGGMLAKYCIRIQRFSPSQ